MNYLTRFTLLILSIACLIQTSLSQTVTKSDYGWFIGASRFYRVGAFSLSDFDLTPGTGKLWTMESPALEDYHHDIFRFRSFSEWPEVTFENRFSRQIGLSVADGLIYYGENDSDIVQVGGVGNRWDTPIPYGLPHYPHKSWQGVYTSPTEDTTTISGNVIASGTLVTQLGSFQALLVRVDYATTGRSYSIYNWETVEHGVTAFAESMSSNLLAVLTSASPPPNSLSSNGLSPSSFSISVYPNPFNAVTTPEYDLPAAAQVSLRVFDLLGNEVAVLQDGFVPAGNHSIAFDGSKLASGLYFVRLEAGHLSQVKKLILLK